MSETETETFKTKINLANGRVVPGEMAVDGSFAHTLTKVVDGFMRLERDVLPHGHPDQRYGVCGFMLTLAQADRIHAHNQGLSTPA